MTQDDPDPAPADHARTRREVLGAAAALVVGAAAGCQGSASKDGLGAASPPSAPATHASARPERQRAAETAPQGTIPLRALGKTGATVEPVSLGGEGILRTRGREREAVPMIEEALRLGVRYCDTAPAYQQSQDYYGIALRNAGAAARKQILLASKTHLRDRDGALRLLDDSLRRLGTDHLDLWQLHDLRSIADLDAIFARDGAISAFEQAKADGRVRFVGITGHYSAAILVEAMRRYPVDTVLCAVNPADPARAPVLDTVVREARSRNIGVIGMKVMAAGRLLRDGAATPGELIRYAASQVDTVIIGCSSIGEVRQNLALRHGFKAMAGDARAALEARIAPRAERYNTFKA